jgi:predicted ATPase/DNA-binding winged helix-turn-helix (wHTH) protein/class 3 adenylate cyclase
MTQLPSGTITFLFCDIEDSVGWWERQPAAMKHDVDRFTAVAEASMTQHGYVVKRTGDGLKAAISTARHAVEAAKTLRRRLPTEAFPFAVRMGIHSGAAEPKDDDYVGRTPNLAARVTDQATGGQIVLSSTAADLARRELPHAASLSLLGQVTLRGIPQPETVWEIHDQAEPGDRADEQQQTAPAPRAPSERHRFGACVLDLAARELLVDDERVELEPRTFAVLAYLVEHRDRVVPKAELLDEVWGDRFVGESALTTRIKHARAAVGDDGRSQAIIKTVHRVGYRFVAEVTVAEQRSGSLAATRSEQPLTSWSNTSRPVFGREADGTAVAARLAAHRMVTVTGPAGVGKTSLAEAVLGGSLASAHANRWFCRLADTRDPDALANVVLTALGESQQNDADPTESLLRVLEERADLVVLDNCEHLVGAAAELCRRILVRCPAVHILATCRGPLGLTDESVYPLEPLDPEAAAACFVARARDAGADVDPVDPALAELCAGLDGIPLALELAAARARMLTPAEMVDLLADRFRLLRDTGGERGDRSLHAAISASWEALSAEDQDLLEHLGVFVGTFTLDDMRHVARPDDDPLDSVDALERLVRQSLVVATSPRGGRNRFRLLESVREFGLEHLQDPEGVRAAHVRHFVARAEELDATCQTEAVDEAVAELHQIWVNLRAAVGYAGAAGDAASVRRILVAVAEYADVFGVYEILSWAGHAGLDEIGTFNFLGKHRRPDPEAP